LTVKATIGLLLGLDVCAGTHGARTAFIAFGIARRRGGIIAQIGWLRQPVRVPPTNAGPAAAITTGRCDGCHCEAGKTSDKSP
jgi:hypothetical protein